ncbi:hypothetical protein DFP72DRAFT_68774 [Ephemerocybe angulata]|uniref:Secreted protein n=1 Tax=Ephemerocybe angulata TaxID=980116 RepID=A0A8H6LVU9_9AGAR|nr:hypothetical protein DFP72DRAFT_68774 [Tulosesus angulatus]
MLGQGTFMPFRFSILRMFHLLRVAHATTDSWPKAGRRASPQFASFPSAVVRYCHYNDDSFPRKYVAFVPRAAHRPPHTRAWTVLVPRSSSSVMCRPYMDDGG